MAAYAARAGMTAVVLAPVDGISPAKVAQTLDYGAHSWPSTAISTMRCGRSAPSIPRWPRSVTA